MGRLNACCIGLLLAIAALGAWSQVPGTRSAVDAVPTLGDLRGKRCDVARAELLALHFDLRACPYGARTGRYPPGTINAQSLEPGTPASRIGTLRVTLEPAAESEAPPKARPESSSGRSGIDAAAAAALAAALAEAIAGARKLPDLRGMTCDEAQAALRPLQLTLAECLPGEADGRYRAGTINAQSVAPGTPVARVENLRARTEPVRESALLPDLRGMRCDEAQVALRPLRVRLAECLPGKAGSGYPAGTISAQSAAPGTPVARVENLRARVEPAPVQRVLPDLRGMTCAEAAEALARFDLAAASCSVGDAVDGAKVGRINAQSPAAGTRLPLAAPLVLRVEPEAKVIVPALIGLDESKAVAALAERRLQARASGPTASRGRRVASQNPQAGTPVDPRSTVAIVLGLSVPRLLGMDCNAARERAAAYGHPQLQCESVAARSPDDAIGRVFEQTPAPGGAALAAPAAIAVSVWGVQPVTVPDVRERGLDDAVAAIEAARLVALPDRRDGERIVAGQSPAPATVVNAGSSVRLETREVVAVPDVVGKSLTAAQASLQQARLRDAADANDHPDDRIVQSQQPAANTRAAVGSAVRLATKRFAIVPDLVRSSCTEAAAKLAREPFILRCDDERSWRVTVFGTPQITSQQPDANARAEAGATITAVARAPLPPSLARLGSVSLVAIAGWSIAPLLLAFALWVAWKILRTKPVPDPEPGPPKPPPRVEWRVVADASPSVSLRPAAKRSGARPAAAKMAWHVVVDPGQVLLREHDPTKGGGDGKR